MLIKCQLLCRTSIIMKHGTCVAILEGGGLSPVPLGHAGLGVSAPAPSAWNQSPPTPRPGLWSHQEMDTGCLSSTSPVQPSRLIVWMVVLPPRPPSSEQCAYSRAWPRGTFIMETAFIRPSRGTGEQAGTLHPRGAAGLQSKLLLLTASIHSGLSLCQALS